MRGVFSSYIVHNEYELLSNVKQKQVSKEEKKKHSIEVIAEQYSNNYDTFMMNIAHLKVSKAFT